MTVQEALSLLAAAARGRRGTTLEFATEEARL